jgi:hypothetical protein
MTSTRNSVPPVLVTRRVLKFSVASALAVKPSLAPETTAPCVRLPVAASIAVYVSRPSPSTPYTDAVPLTPSRFTAACASSRYER